MVTWEIVNETRVNLGNDKSNLAGESKTLSKTLRICTFVYRIDASRIPQGF